MQNVPRSPSSVRPCKKKKNQCPLSHAASPTRGLARGRGRGVDYRAEWKKSCNCQQFQVLSKWNYLSEFRTVYGIEIRPFVRCEIGHWLTLLNIFITLFRKTINGQNGYLWPSGHQPISDKYAQIPEKSFENVVQQRQPMPKLCT